MELVVGHGATHRHRNDDNALMVAGAAVQYTGQSMKAAADAGAGITSSPLPRLGI